MLTQPCTVSFGEQRCPALYFRVTLGSLVPWYFVSSSQQNKIKEAKRKSNTSIFEFLFLRETWVLKEMKRRKKLCKWTGDFCSSFFFFGQEGKAFQWVVMGSKWTLMLSLPWWKNLSNFSHFQSDSKEIFDGFFSLIQLNSHKRNKILILSIASANDRKISKRGVFSLIIIILKYIEEAIQLCDSFMVLGF